MMKPASLRRAFLGGAAPFLLAASLAAGPASAVSYTNLYSFTGGADGGTPCGAVVFDETGTLYATTYFGGSEGDGAVFKLTPPSTGTAWAETVLYTFTGLRVTKSAFEPPDAYPTGALIFDSAGALYGTSAGTVFKLSPPAAGQSAWVHTRLHDFTGFDGAYPTYGALIFDSHGSLYGATTSAVGADRKSLGNVYGLSPPVGSGKTWSLKVLHEFSASEGFFPFGSLAISSNGALYGALEAGFGYKLTPPAGGKTGWQESFLPLPAGAGQGPFSGPIWGHSGSLYGTTSGLLAAAGGSELGGAVYHLIPPAAGHTTWTAETLYEFSGGYQGTDPTDGGNPYGPLVMGSSGDLYGTTIFGGASGSCSAPFTLPYGPYGDGNGGNPVPGCGTVFRLSPPATGKTAWTETVLYRFTGGSDGAYPIGGLVIHDGALFGTASGGGASGHGAVFKVVP